MTVAVAPEFIARVRRNEPMRKHTSWHVGGPAEVFFNPHGRTDLAAFLRMLRAGSADLLARSRQQPAGARWRHGWRGDLDAWRTRSSRAADETTIYVEAGVACARVAKQCIKWGLGPAEFFAGIPGTLGGALAMNAGAFGGETWQHVVEVETIDRHGHEHTARRRERISGELSARRDCRSPTNGSCRARLRFERRKAVNEAQVRDLLAKRKATQPIGEWSGGSTFTNPPGDHAARLIESAGPQGLSHRRCLGIGEAREFHHQSRERDGRGHRGR